MKQKIIYFLAGLILGAAIGAGVMYFINNAKSYDEQYIADDEIEESEPAQFSEDGNITISDEEKKLSIEILPPQGFAASADESTLYTGEFVKEDGSTGMSYYIGTYNEEEMANYYDEYVAFMTSEGMEGYSDVTASDVNTMQVNGYNVNYIKFSYTYGDEEGKENYTEYTAYIMLEDEKELICSIYGYEGEVSEDIIKECFNFEIPAK